MLLVVLLHPRLLLLADLLLNLHSSLLLTLLAYHLQLILTAQLKHILDSKTQIYLRF